MRFRLTRSHAFARASLESILFTTVTFVMAAALFYLAVRQAMLQWEFRIPFPFWDMIGFVSFLDDVPRPSILDLYHFRPNEHRPIVPFLFYLWDHNSYGDSGAVLYPAIMVSNALLAASLFGILAVRRKFDIALKMLFAAIVVLSFFSILNFENLTWQLQIHEILCLTLLSFGRWWRRLFPPAPTATAAHRLTPRLHYFPGFVAWPRHIRLGSGLPRGRQCLCIAC